MTKGNSIKKIIRKGHRENEERVGNKGSISVRARARREAESGTERRKDNRKARKKTEERAETQKQSEKGVEVQKKKGREME